MHVSSESYLEYWLTSVSIYFIASSLAEVISLQFGFSEGRNILAFLCTLIGCYALSILKPESLVEILEPLLTHSTLYYHYIVPPVVFFFLGYNFNIKILKNNILQTLVIGLVGNLLYLILLYLALLWLNPFTYGMDVTDILYLVIITVPLTTTFSSKYFKMSSIHTKHVEQLLEIEAFIVTTLSLPLHSAAMLWNNKEVPFLISLRKQGPLFIWDIFTGWFAGILSCPTFIMNDSKSLFFYTVGIPFSLGALNHTLLKFIVKFPSSITFGTIIRNRNHLGDEDTETDFRIYWNNIFSVIELSLYMVCAARVTLRGIQIFNDLNAAFFICIFSILIRAILWFSYSLISKNLFGYRLPLSVTTLCIFAPHKHCVSLLSAIHLYIYSVNINHEVVTIVSLYITLYSLIIFIIFPILFRHTDLIELSKKHVSKFEFLYDRLMKERTDAELVTKKSLISANANWLMVNKLTDIDKPKYQLNLIKKKNNNEKNLSTNKISTNVRDICKPTKYVKSVDADKSDSDESREDIMAYPETDEYIMNKIQKKLFERDLISYSRQHNQGIISRVTHSYLIEISEVPVFKYRLEISKMKLPLEKFYTFLVNMFLLFYDKPIFNGELSASENQFRRNVFDLITSLEYRAILTVLIYLDSICQLLVIYFYATGNREWANNFQMVDYICYGFFITVFLVHLIGLGFIKYFQQRIRTIEFFVAVIIRTVMHSLIYIQIYYERLSEYDILLASQTVIYLKFFFLLRLTVIQQFTNNKCILCAANIFAKLKAKSLIKFYEKRYGRSIGYNDLLPTYHNIFGTTMAGRHLSRLMIQRRTAIEVKMLLLENFNRGLTCAMKSKHVAFKVLNYSELVMEELLRDGFVYDYEKWIFRNSLVKIRNELRNLATVENPKALELFNNIFWLKGDYTCRMYMLKHARMRVYHPEQVILDFKQELPDLQMITSGVCEYIYKSDSSALYRLVLKGILPTSDYYLHLKFHEVQRDYLSPGNLIGEFGLITGRAYNMKVWCKTAVTTLSIPFKSLLKLFYKCHFGRYRISKLWKAFGARLALKLFPIYFKILTREKLRMRLNYSFVPILEEAKVIRISDDVSDIILIEGMITDALTRCELLAPLHITASNQTFILNQYINVYNVAPRLMLVPKRGVNRATLLDSYSLVKNFIKMEKVTPKFVGIDSCMKISRKQKIIKKFIQANKSYLVIDFIIQENDPKIIIPCCFRSGAKKKKLKRKKHL